MSTPDWHAISGISPTTGLDDRPLETGELFEFLLINNKTTPPKGFTLVARGKFNSIWQRYTSSADASQ